MRNPAIKFALIAFVITVVWTLAEHVLGYNTTNHAVGQYTRMLTAFVFYFFIVWTILVKKKEFDNSISFANAFRGGCFMCIIYSFLTTLWFALYAEVINTQYQPTLMAFERSKLEASNLSPVAIADKMKEVELTSGGSVSSYILLFIFTALIGSIIAFVTAIIVRKKAG